MTPKVHSRRGGEVGARHGSALRRIAIAATLSVPLASMILAVGFHQTSASTATTTTTSVSEGTPPAASDASSLPPDTEEPNNADPVPPGDYSRELHIYLRGVPQEVEEAKVQLLTSVASPKQCVSMHPDRWLTIKHPNDELVYTYKIENISIDQVSCVLRPSWLALAITLEKKGGGRVDEVGVFIDKPIGRDGDVRCLLEPVPTRVKCTSWSWDQVTLRF